MSNEIQIDHRLLNHEKHTQLVNDLIALGGFFGPRLNKVIPLYIHDEPTLEWIFTLTRNLKGLESVEGFTSLLKEFEKDAEMAYLTTLMACHMNPHVDKLRILPSMESVMKGWNIWAEKGGDEIFVDCKSTPHFIQSDYLPDHEEMFEELKKYVNKPHHLTIRYVKRPTRKELRDLGKILESKLPETQYVGYIYDDKNLDVHVDATDPEKRATFEGAVPGMRLDPYTQSSLPCHTIFKEGKSIAFIGPRLNATEAMITRVRKFRFESPTKRNLFMAVSANYMWGPIQENQMALAAGYLPEPNTSLSGVALVKHHLPEIQFDLSVNPFAKFPVQDSIRKIFK